MSDSIETASSWEAARQSLKESVTLPLQFPRIFEGSQSPCLGVLLYGASDADNARLVSSVVMETELATFFHVSASELTSQWLGEPELLLRNLFRQARDARPSIVFVDELNLLCEPSAEDESNGSPRLATEFLVQMRDRSRDCAVLAATSRPWVLTDAVLRCFGRRIRVPPPDASATGRDLPTRGGHQWTTRTVEMRSLGNATALTNKEPVDISVLDVRESVTDISDVRESVTDISDVRESVTDVSDVRESVTEVRKSVIDVCGITRSLRLVRPTVSEEDLLKLEKFDREFGQGD